MNQISVSAIQNVLRKYEPGCCNGFFGKRTIVPQSVADLKNLINKKMGPDESLTDSGFYTFLCILNRKYDTQSTMERVEQTHLHDDLMLLIPVEIRTSILNLPKEPLFFNYENVTVMCQTNNSRLFASELMALESLAKGFKSITGTDYPLLGEQINLLRGIASADVANTGINENSNDPSLQYKKTLEETRLDIKHKIGQPSESYAHALTDVELRPAMSMH